jgi:hypothetical protein
VPELSEEVTEEGEGGLAIVDVAGAILDPEELGGLGEESGDGVVAGDLAAVGVVATEGALDLEAGGDHGAVHIHGESLKLQGLQGLDQDVRVEGLQGGTNGGGATRQPATEGAFPGKYTQPAEAQDQRVSLQITDMTKATGSDHEHGQEQANDPDRREVPGGITRVKVPPEEPRKTKLMKELAEQLEAGVGGQTIAREADGQVGLDGSGQIAFSMSHRWCLSVREEVGDASSSYTTDRPIRQGERRPPSRRTAFFYAPL